MTEERAKKIQAVDRNIKEMQDFTSPDELYQELIKSVKKYQRLQDWIEYLESTELENEGDKNVDHSLRIMTIHGSKGLEFDEVWILNCNEGIFPSGKNLTEEEVEEERRIFYVAMTRAKKKLHLCYLKGTEDNRMECSRFIKGLIKFEEQI